MHRLLAAPLVLVVAASGCVIVGDPTCGAGGASIVVTPSVVVIAVGQSATPTGNDSWCDSGHQAHGSPEWALAAPADSAFVSLDLSTGRVTGRRAGAATVLAKSAHTGATSRVLVTVY